MLIFCFNWIFRLCHKSCAVVLGSLSVPFAGVHFATRLESTLEFSATRSYATRPSTIQNGDAYRDGTGDVVWLCNNGNSWCLCCEVVATASYTCETEQPTWLDSAPHDTLPRIILFRICRRLIATHTTRLYFVAHELAEREVQNTNTRPSHQNLLPPI